VTRALIVVALASACTGDVDPAWQLDHDRIVAVRATPSHVPAGQHATIDALIAHKGAPTDVETPTRIAALAPFAGAVAPDGTIVAPDDATLAAIRTQQQLAADAPVPLVATVLFGTLAATKVVYLGDAADDPALPPVTVAGAPPGAALTFPFDTDVPLAADADPTWMVNWLTSVGKMHDDNEHAAFVHVSSGDSTSGELAVVVRDAQGGVVWQVWPASSAAP
jgi:hypothetical protein